METLENYISPVFHFFTPTSINKKKVSPFGRWMILYNKSIFKYIGYLYKNFETFVRLFVPVSILNGYADFDGIFTDR